MSRGHVVEVLVSVFALIGCVSLLSTLWLETPLVTAILGTIVLLPFILVCTTHLLLIVVLGLMRITAPEHGE